MCDVSFLRKITKYKDETKRKRLEEKFMEASEVSMLIDSMNIETWKDLSLFLVLTGLRVGEAIALDYTDIDIPNRNISITKTYDHNNNVVTTPKTRSSVRDVSIQDELLPLCIRLVKEAKINLLMHGEPALFHHRGKRVLYDSYRIYVTNNSEKVLGRRIGPHTLRHTHASLCFENGMAIDEISRRLGHEDSKITREIYTHITERLKEKEKEKMRSVKLL